MLYYKSMKFKISKLFKQPKNEADKTFDKILKILRYIGLTLDLMVIERKLWREFPDQMYERNQKNKRRILKEEIENFKNLISCGSTTFYMVNVHGSLF